MYILLGNALVFGALSFVWTSKNWTNTFIKFLLLVKCVINAYIWHLLHTGQIMTIKELF